MSKITVIIPCYNEEITIKSVIEDFKEHLPEATIVVYDNNSTDKTSEIASSCGVVVKKELRQGKGNVIRTAFREIDSDIYIMVDGDNTYPAKHARELLEPILNNEADIVIGDRHSTGAYAKENKRSLHGFGNNLVKTLINKLFNSDLKDIMSGYRVMNRRFVKNIPITSDGFEIETEMTLHTLDKKFRIKEIPIEYRDRPEGSYSKLNTFKDGFRVLKTILWVFKDYKPLMFFSLLASLFFILGLCFGIPPVIEYMQSGYVYKVPSAILATGLMLISVISLFSGFILDSVVKFHKEQYELKILDYELFKK
ncbi:MAG: glycosyltransferase family 2 protein [Campylobacterales bacterium]